MQQKLERAVKISDATFERNVALLHPELISSFYLYYSRYKTVI